MQKSSKSIHRKKLNVKQFAKFIFVFAAFMYVTCTLINQQCRMNERDVLVKKYESMISEAKLEQQQLKKELSKVNSDEYLEKMAREKLGLIKANERVFVDITRD